MGSHAGDAVRIYNFSNGKLLSVLGKLKPHQGGVVSGVSAATFESTDKKNLKNRLTEDGLMTRAARREHRRQRTRKRMEMKKSGALRQDVQLRGKLKRTDSVIDNNGHGGNGSSNNNNKRTNSNKSNGAKSMPLPPDKAKKAATVKKEENRRGKGRRVSIDMSRIKTAQHQLRDDGEEISQVVFALSQPPSMKRVNSGTGAGRQSARQSVSKVTKIPLILSTGWDRRIHVWKESSGADEVSHHAHHDSENHRVVPCSKRIPESDAVLKSSLHHTDDVTTLCFCPPLTIVTGGYGGLLVGWHVHSGAARWRHRFAQPVEAMCWMGETIQGFLAVGRSDGAIAIFNVEEGCVLEDCSGPFPPDNESTLLSELCCDNRGEYVCMGDSQGGIHVFTTMAAGNSGLGRGKEIYVRQLTCARLLCADSISSPQLTHSPTHPPNHTTRT